MYDSTDFTSLVNFDGTVCGSANFLKHATPDELAKRRDVWASASSGKASNFLGADAGVRNKALVTMAISTAVQLPGALAEMGVLQSQWAYNADRLSSLSDMVVKGMTNLSPNGEHKGCLKVRYILSRVHRGVVNSSQDVQLMRMQFTERHCQNEHVVRRLLYKVCSKIISGPTCNTYELIPSECIIQV